MKNFLTGMFATIGIITVICVFGLCIFTKVNEVRAEKAVDVKIEEIHEAVDEAIHLNSSKVTIEKMSNGDIKITKNNGYVDTSVEWVNHNDYNY